MLSHIKEDLQDSTADETKFSDMYSMYVFDIQDMDIENEILPLIKRESTEAVKLQKRFERSRKIARRKMNFGL